MTQDLASVVRLYRDALGRAPIVLLDMDEVLCQWDAQFVASHRAQFPHLAVADVGERTSFDLFHGLNEEHRAATLAVVNAPGFFAELAPVDGAIDAVRELRAAGIDVAICSSPWLANPTCASDKFRWIERHLGADMANATVITRDKTRVRGDVLIDDKPQITGAMTPEWDLVRFTFRYNEHLPGARITGWTDWQPTLTDTLLHRLARLDVSSA